MPSEAKRLPVGPNSTLILKGPASARLVEGSLEVLGYRPGSKERLVAKPWRSLPLYSREGAIVEVSLGEGGGAEIVGEDTIPDDWRELSSSLGDSFRLMVIGMVDSGKTSLITYLYNTHVPRGRMVVADLDMGQSEICPPTTIALAIGGKPSPSLSALEPNRVYPVGYTSPSYLTSRALESVAELSSTIGSERRLLVNTDGWVDGEAARRHKSQLIRILKPSHVVLIGMGEAEDLVEASEEVGAELTRVSAPKVVLKRDHSARKALRELSYARYLRGARLRSIPRRWLRARPLLLAGLPLEDYLREVIGEMEESAHHLTMLVNGLEMTEAGIGILSYIWASDRHEPSLALFMGIDDKGFARFYTPYEGTIELMEVGAVILSTDYREVYVLRPRINV
jgi:polynucleotide 5'-hydroxyl-kinase GRC3/NOL9